MNLMHRSEGRTACPHNIDNAHRTANLLVADPIRILRSSTMDKPANGNSEQKDQKKFDLFATLATCLALAFNWNFDMSMDGRTVF
ncbi:MAG: hypothetical protein ACJ8HF_22065 [Pseudomonas sp.]